MTKNRHTLFLSFVELSFGLHLKNPRVLLLLALAVMASIWFYQFSSVQLNPLTSFTAEGDMTDDSTGPSLLLAIFPHGAGG